MSDETGTSKGDVTALEPTRPQQVVARRVAEAKATVPEVAISTEADVTDAVALLSGPGAGATFDDLVVRAAALALRETPHANAAYRDGHFERYSRVNVGIAVAGPDALVIPTLYDADAKNLTTLAAEARDLTERARAGTLSPSETRGATFTVFSLAGHGVTTHTPILTPPQAANLGVGSVRPLPRVVDGDVAVRHVVALTLVSDHRILYGADAAGFLGRIRALLESPSDLAA